MAASKQMSVTFRSKVIPIKPVNDEFTLCKCYVQGIGKNRNLSYMSKENVEKYLPTLNYCPVVGHLKEYIDDEGVKHRYIGGHDCVINENWELVDLTVPYGVVINDSFDFEMIEEYGKDVEYLTAMVILWTGRYPELMEAIYSENLYFNESMEINVFQYRPLEGDSTYTELLEWAYSALCLLGKADDKNSEEHTEPCFISSSIIPIEFSKSEFANALNEMKEKISFYLEEFSSEANDNKLEDCSNMINSLKGNLERENDNNKSNNSNLANNEKTSTSESGASDPIKALNYQSLYEELKIAYDLLEKEFSTYQVEHSFLNADFEDLKDFKEKTEKAQRAADENALFSEFEERIGETNEFRDLKENASKFTIRELRRECLCIVGLYAYTNSVPTKTNDTKPYIKFSVESIDSDAHDNEPYGGIMKKYLNK